MFIPAVLVSSFLMLQPPEAHIGRQDHDECWAIPRFTQTSALFKIYLIVAAAQVWGHLWSGNTVVFFTDNQATSEIIKKGRFGSLLIMYFIRRLIWLSLQFSFHIQCRFINEVQNTAADALSRFNFLSFFQQVPDADICADPLPQCLLLRMDSIFTGRVH